MFPKITVLRLLILVGFIFACVTVYDALPSPVRSVMILVILVGSNLLIQYWLHRDEAAEGTGGEDAVQGVPEPSEPRAGRMVYRVRWWVRLVSVAVPLLGLPFVVQPQLLNPEWEDGIPPVEMGVMAFVYLVLGLAAWAAFRARLDVDDHFVRVINPWHAQSFLRADVRAAQAGGRGLELLLGDGRVVVVFAVQCVGGTGSADRRPRWVEVARAVTGRDPVA